MDDFTRTDFVHVIKGKTLKEAIKYIETFQNTVNRNPVTVFQSVLSKEEIDSISITAHLENNKSIKVIKEKVNVIKENVHEICPMSTDSQNRLDLITLSKENTEFMERYLDESDNKYGLRMFNKYFEETVHGQFTALYGRDSTVAPNGVRRLNFEKSTLVGNKKNVKGVTTSMWYVSSPGSGTVFHNEDGDQPSINLSLCGKEKLYAFIPLLFAKKLAEKVNPEVKCELFHKPGLIISPKLLLEWKIPVQFYAQKPGDLVYIGEAVLHCVVNNGCTIAEAINYGTKASITRSSLTICECKKKGRLTVEGILKKPITQEKVPQSQKKTYKCNVKGCLGGKLIYTKKALMKHNFELHGMKQFKCEFENCDKSFMRQEALTLHIQKEHARPDAPESHNHCDRVNKNATVEKCEFCQDFFTKKNMDRHVEEKHVGNPLVICDKCGGHFYKRNLVRHLKTCQGLVECDVCGKKFTMSRYLNQHKKSHK